MPRQSFEGGTNGTTITTANAGGPQNDQFNSVPIGGSSAIIFDSTRAAHGSLSCKQTTGGTIGSCSVRWTTAGGSQTTSYIRFYIYITANPAAMQRLFTVTNAAQNQQATALSLLSNGTLQAANGVGTPVLTTTQAVNLNGWTRIEMRIITSTTVGQIGLRMYKSMDSTTADEDLSVTNTNAGTLCELWDFGQTYATIVNTTTWFDDIATGTNDWLGPLGLAKNDLNGTAGVVITPANSGGVGRTPLDIVTKDPTATNEYFAGAAHGSGSAQLATASTPGIGSSLQWNAAVGAHNTVWIRFYIWVSGPMSVSMRIFSAVTANGANLSAAIDLQVNGTLSIIDGSGNDVLFTGAPIAFGAWNRIEAKFVASPTVGQIELKLFKSSESTTPDSTITTSANRNVPAPIGIYDFGHGYNVRGNFQAWYDDLATSITGYIGPFAQLIQASAALIATPTLTVTGTRKMGIGAVLVASPTLTITARLPLQFPNVTLIASLYLQVKGSLPSKIPTEIFTRYPYPPQEYPFRLIAQEILTGKFVDWDLPVQPDFSYTTQLSGPTAMSGAFPPEIVSIQDLGLDGYAYYFHVEISGEVRATGIFLPPQHEDTALNFTCEGFSSITHYITWGGQISEIGIDPLYVVRQIWNHVQSNPRSNLGVIVSNNTSNKKLGTPAHTQITKNEDGTTTIEDVEAAPYELVWWNSPNCGETIDNLATQTPFDFRERVKWNSTKTAVELYFDLGYPRIGIPRDGLLFNEENVLEVVPIQETDETYASEVIVIGAGEGSLTVRGYAAEPYGNRVRRVQVVTDKTVTTVERANALATTELGLRKGSNFSIDELVIHARHENATIGEYDIGDDIFVNVIIPWLPLPHTAWYRILAISYQPATEIVRLKVALSSSFNYSTEPTDVPHTVTDDVRAAQAILDRMKSGEEISEDWTWEGCPDYVNAWNDSLISQFIATGVVYNWPAVIPQAVVWLQAYIIARM